MTWQMAVAKATASKRNKAIQIPESFSLKIRNGRYIQRRGSITIRAHWETRDHFGTLVFYTRRGAYLGTRTLSTVGELYADMLDIAPLNQWDWMAF